MKLKLSWCPCMSLQRGCTILAAIEVGVNLTAISLLIVALVVYYGKDGFGIGTISVAILTYLLRTHRAVRLHRGAKNRDKKDIRIWLIIATVSTTINVINFVVHTTTTGIVWASFTSFLLTNVYSFYEILVARSFYKELKSDLLGPSASSSLLSNVA